MPFALRVVALLRQSGSLFAAMEAEDDVLVEDVAAYETVETSEDVDDEEVEMEMTMEMSQVTIFGTIDGQTVAASSL